MAFIYSGTIRDPRDPSIPEAAKRFEPLFFPPHLSRPTLSGLTDTPSPRDSKGSQRGPLPPLSTSRRQQSPHPYSRPRAACHGLQPGQHTRSSTALPGAPRSFALWTTTWGPSRGHRTRICIQGATPALNLPPALLECHCGPSHLPRGHLLCRTVFRKVGAQ